MTTQQTAPPVVYSGVSPDHHPETLRGAIEKALDVENTLGREALRLGREMLTLSYETSHLLNTAERAVLEDSADATASGRPGARRARLTAELLEQVERSGERVARELQSRHDSIAKIERALEQRVQAAVTDNDLLSPAGAALATEIRAHVKALPEAKRVPFVAKAIEDGDKKTVSAIVNNPAYLSGLGEDLVALLKTQAEKKFSGEALQRDVVGALLARVRAATESVMRRHEQILTEARVQPHIKKALASRAALKKLGEGVKVS